MKFFQKIKSAIKFVLNQIQPKTIIRANIVQLAPSELLKGRCALITGGTSGIGFAIAQAFLNAGASVCITGRSQERLNSALEKLNNNRAFAVVMDMTQINTFDEKFSEVIGKLGSVDILVNNAGVSGNGESAEAIFDLAIFTNLKGPYFLLKTIANYMRKNKIFGNVLNIASASSLRPGVSPYILSKHGIKALTVGAAKCLIKDNIVVNGIAPGPTATPMLHADNSDISLPNNPLGRYATQEEIANMAVVLVSGLGRTIVGDIVYMTGGAGTITVDDISYSF